ncbi:sensor histidine kinase [Arcicella rigui]|uniref:Histidine kinase n=1 Tax=Arcicella rigui TaxID=797020 RepID=A0ABU5QDH9_9BACT|nr:histidine kinase [Arcicella rigui]MEA5140901.1 histidine kinase [Arcicella rigui]
MLINPSIRKFVWGVSFLVALFVNFPIIFLNLPRITKSNLAIADVTLQLLLCFVYSMALIHFLYRSSHANITKSKQYTYAFLIFLGFVLILSAVNISIIQLSPMTTSTVVVRGVLIALIDYFFSRFLTETDRKNEVLLENEQLKQENLMNQLSALKNQLNPHFLFNSLNTLSWLINEDKAKSQLYLQKLSQVLRYSLSMQEQTMVNLKDELILMDNYIFLLQMRFGENLKITQKLEGKEKFRIPPHSLQLLIENAIKHNVISSNSPLKITIKIKPDEEIIIVSNTIHTKANSAGTGIGLVNLSERFRLLVGREIEILQDKAFTVILPLIP